MRAAVYYGVNDVRIEEIERPRIREDEVLIKVHACGVCGTDVHIAAGDEGSGKTPCGTVLGHEFAGEIVETGARVSSLHIGERVCVDPNILCGKCSYCRSGEGHFCENIKGIGTAINGGFAEYCAVPESQVYKIGADVSYNEAAMCEPLACCLHGIEMCDISCGDTVAIYGGGMIGMIMLQLAVLSGAAQVIMIEPVAEKRQTALKLGAKIVIDPFTEDIHKVLRDSNIQRINTVIECVGRIDTIKSAIEIAGKRSTVMMFGLTKPKDELTIKPFEMFKKEITLKASFINPYTQGAAVKLVNEKKTKLAEIIYSVTSLDELAEVLRNRELQRKGKFVINPFAE